MSSDGISWQRGTGAVSGTRAADDAGACMESDGGDWWTLDTHSLAVSDVQMFSSSAVNSGTGVYWMFYTGCNYDESAAPPALESLVGAAADAEGLCGRPGLAMSQVRRCEGTAAATACVAPSCGHERSRTSLTRALRSTVASGCSCGGLMLLQAGCVCCGYSHSIHIQNMSSHACARAGRP